MAGRLEELQCKLVRDTISPQEREELESLAARARFGGAYAENLAVRVRFGGPIRIRRTGQPDSNGQMRRQGDG